jgi:hypothetical protein
LQRVGVFQQVVRHSVILHHFTIFSVRPKGAHAFPLEVGPVGVVYLEVEGIVGDEGEEEIAAIDPNAAEHAAGPDIPNTAGQLLDHECLEAGADAHNPAVGDSCTGNPRRVCGGHDRPSIIV